MGNQPAAFQLHINHKLIPNVSQKVVVSFIYIQRKDGVKAKLFCPEIAGLFCRIAGLFCHDSRANLSLKPVCFGIAIS